MVKYSYDVSSPHVGDYPRRKKDDSFSSCLCTMLVFFSIMLLLLLLSFWLGKSKPSKKMEDDQSSINDLLRYTLQSTTRNAEQKITTTTEATDYAPPSRILSDALTTLRTTEDKTTTTPKPIKWETSSTKSTNISEITTTAKSNTIKTEEIETKTSIAKIPTDSETEAAPTEYEIISQTKSKANNTSYTAKLIVPENETTTRIPETEPTTTEITTSISDIIRPAEKRTVHETTHNTSFTARQTVPSIITTTQETEEESSTTTLEAETPSESDTIEPSEPVSETTQTDPVTTTTEYAILTETKSPNFDVSSASKVTNPEEEPLTSAKSQTGAEISITATDADNKITTTARPKESETKITTLYQSSTMVKGKEYQTKSTEFGTTTSAPPKDIKEKSTEIASTTMKHEVMGTTPMTLLESRNSTEVHTATPRIILNSTEIRETTTPESNSEVIGNGGKSEDPTKSDESNFGLSSDDLSEQDSCNNTECELAVAKIVGSTDLTKLPCENFYQFASGANLVAKKEEMDVFSSISTNSFDGLSFIHVFKTFYQSCVRHEDRFNYEERIEEARTWLFSINKDFPDFNYDEKTEQTLNLTAFVADLVIFKAMPFFDVDVDIDSNSSMFVLRLFVPDQNSDNVEHWTILSETREKCLRETDEIATESALNMTKLYGNFQKCQKNYSNYLDSIESSVKQLKMFPSNLTEDGRNEYLQNIRSFIEKNILSLFDKIDSPADLRQSIVRKEFDYIELQQLEEKFPIIKWEEFFKLISNKDLMINKKTMVEIYNGRSLENVFRAFKEMDPRKFMQVFLAILANMLFQNTILPVHKYSRVEYCKKQSEALMPDIVNYLYKKIIINEEELTQQNSYINKLYKNITKQFMRSLQNKEWLSEESRNSMVNKVNGTVLKTFNIDDSYNDDEEDFLTQIYHDFQQMEKDKYQKNLHQLMIHRKRMSFEVLGQNVSSELMFRYFVDAAAEEPAFFYPINQVYIPLGLAKKVKKDLPIPVMMAQVGFPLAKMIGKAFDSTGMKYDVLLTETTSNSYIIFAEGVRDQISFFNSVYFENSIVHFLLNNKVLSESDRIADSTALKLIISSFNEYNQSLPSWVSKQFSREEIFSIALAQELYRKMTFSEFMVEAYESDVLPPQLRIETILANIEDSVPLFGCNRGSGLKRIEEPSQFPYLDTIYEQEQDYSKK